MVTPSHTGQKVAPAQDELGICMQVESRVRYQNLQLPCEIAKAKLHYESPLSPLQASSDCAMMRQGIGLCDRLNCLQNVLTWVHKSEVLYTGSRCQICHADSELLKLVGNVRNDAPDMLSTWLWTCAGVCTSPPRSVQRKSESCWRWAGYKVSRNRSAVLHRPLQDRGRKWALPTS